MGHLQVTSSSCSSDFGFSAAVTGVIVFNETESTDANDAISAWVGDECRGVKTDGLTSPFGNTVFGLTVYFNQENGTDNNLTFKAYQASTGQISEDIVMTLNGSEYSSYAFAINEIALIILQLLASNNCCSAKNLCKSYVVIGFGCLVSETGSTSVSP